MALERWFAKGFLKLLALGALGAASLSLPSSAQSKTGWELCNQTSYVIEAATGRPDGEEVIVEGWTRLRPGQCRATLQGPLKAGVYFVFARSSKAHRGGQRDWSGEIPLCVDTNGSFAVENPSSCASMGLEQRGFQAVRFDKSNGSMTFKETDLYNKGGQSPENAGVQRLLNDAGIFQDVVDGYLGRETRAAITDFLVDRKQPVNTSMGDLIDILEDVARKRSMQVGMMLCNRTGNRIVAAMARFRPDGLESRGWWTIEANLCVRTVDESLITAPHYVFAEMPTPQGVRLLKGAATKFCTSRAQFAILGNENCEQRRYRSEKFVETAAPEEGKLVYEFFDSAFAPPVRPQP
ncbi:MAG: DUF1036 domain-containing protein [Burkholderiales bacterium]|nr:MAG: DUF1036 domain-containing protein [Burkholderiales bacterium]